MLEVNTELNSTHIIELSDPERHIFDTYPHGAIVIDPRNFHIVHANQHVANIFDVPSGNLVNQSLSRILSGHEQRSWMEQFRNNILAVIAGKKIASRQTEFPISSTSLDMPGPVYLEYSMSVLRRDDNGDASLVACYIENVTAREVDLQKRIRRLMLEISQRMVSIVNHNVNNILNNIISSHTFRQYKDQSFDINGSNVLPGVLDRLKGLVSFIRKPNYLLYPGTIKPQPACLNGVLLDLCEDIGVQSIFRENEINFTHNLSDLSDLLVCNIDKDNIRMVLDELLKNAVEAIKAEQLRKKAQNVIDKGEDKNISFHVEITEITGRQYAQIMIRDTGVMISDSSKVFDYWFSTKSSVPGYGLGLPFARNSVERHGGIVELSQDTQQDNTSKGVVIMLPINEIIPKPAISEYPSVYFLTNNNNITKVSSTIQSNPFPGYTLGSVFANQVYSRTNPEGESSNSIIVLFHSKGESLDINLFRSIKCPFVVVSDSPIETPYPANVLITHPGIDSMKQLRTRLDRLTTDLMLREQYQQKCHNSSVA